LLFKLNQDRRHHIPKQQRTVINWTDYDASLRQRGSLTVWFTAEAIAGWRAEPRTTAGGQPLSASLTSLRGIAARWYSFLAILTALTLQAVFRLALRQTEGLIGSVIGLLGLELQVPDHSTLSRRAATLEVPRPSRSSAGDDGESEPLHLLVDSTGLRLCGAGEWLIEKHGTHARRSWRKLHLGLDAETGQIVAAALMAKDVDDAAQVGPLLDRVRARLSASLTSLRGIATRWPRSPPMAPTTKAALTTTWPGAIPTQPSSCRRAARPCRARRLRARRRSATAISNASPSTAAWLGRRPQAPTRAPAPRRPSRDGSARWKPVIGDGLRSRKDERRTTEVEVAVHGLNRMLAFGRPISVRIAGPGTEVGRVRPHFGSVQHAGPRIRARAACASSPDLPPPGRSTRLPNTVDCRPSATSPAWTTQPSR